LISVHKIPGINRAVALVGSFFADGSFYPFFFIGGDVNEGVAGAEEEFKFFAEVNDLGFW
jgi:hypothetical protein